MKVIAFRWYGKFGHFLRAEANASALSYPVPPPTTIFGLLGAVLGLDKDSAQTVLAGSHLAVSGKIPQKHWHKVKLRKDPPAPLPFTIKKNTKGTSSRQRATLIRQEWLIFPDFTVYAALPEEYHNELAERLRCKKWYFPPCFGISEFIARLDFITEFNGRLLPKGEYMVDSTVLNSTGKFVPTEGVYINKVRLPSSVSEERVFMHKDYLVERNARPFKFETDKAWRVGDKTVVFL